MTSIWIRLASLTAQRALLMGLGFTAFWYFLMFEDGSDVQKKINTVRADLQVELAKEKESDAALKEIAAIQASVGALSDQFKLVSAQLPTDLQMAEMIRTVDKVAKAAGLNVKAKEPRTAQKQDVIEVLPIRVSAEGTFMEITTFFYYLSTIERIVRVKNFVMSTGLGEKKSAKLTVETDIVSYRFLPSEAGKAAGGVK